ncbi:MAG: hypothetical protein DWQ02_02910 [Bacteroidetes bacterium]|nr:MAG: hypothetical protein DWQ02_02910 [Bacteroidota bacterium]
MKNTILIILLLCIYSCKEIKKEVSPNGVWQQLGYGKIFEIENDSVRIFDICNAGCNVYEHRLLADEGAIIKCSSDSLVLKKNIKTYRFKRLEKLPQICQGSGKETIDPIHNFEVLWNTFNEHYCYFSQRNIDWKKYYDIYKSKITNETSQTELFVLFDEMLSSIDDGHVELYVPESLEDTLSKLEQNNENQSAISPIVNRFELSDMIINRYCREYKTHNAGIVKWGFMEDNIAYLQVNAMWLMAFYDIPDSLSLNEFGAHYQQIMSQRTFQRQDEIDGAKRLMDSIFNDIQHATALIIDFRFNTGGKDEVGLEIIGHLVNKKTKIASKKAKLGNTFTNHQNIYLEARSPYFEKDVYVLTSSVTASASEVAVLSTLSLDNLTKIGSSTEGVFSDGLDKKLPIGWEYTLSNEIYEDMGGNNYEGTGIAPDIDINYPTDKPEFFNMLYHQVKGSGDEAIERVFQIQNDKH